MGKKMLRGVAKQKESEEDKGPSGGCCRLPARVPRTHASQAR